MSNLAIDLRPSSLDQVIGNAPVKKAIQSFIDKGSFPNCFLLSGPPGTGKTTLAHIIARAAQGSDEEGFDIRQINGSDKNGVDDARLLADASASNPFVGKYRVFIIDEAHRMTSAAQDCLLIPMEFNPAMWILCSTDPSKLLPAIKSRCAAATFELKPLTRSEVAALVAKQVGPYLDQQGGDECTTFLHEKGINAPREVLGVLDQYISGVPLKDCAHGSEHEPLYKDVASAVLSGNWTKTAGLLAQIPTADYRGMVAMVSAFLAGALLKEPIGVRADGLATCLVGLGSNQFADGVAYAAAKGLLYKTCKVIGGSK